MSQPTPAAPPTPPHRRMSFPRWVRAVSEQQLLVAAQREIARRYGTPAPPPRGIDVFWQRVYVPLFHKLPYPLRSRVANRMPGSHRRTWHQPQQVQGPAV